MVSAWWQLHENPNKRNNSAARAVQQHQYHAAWSSLPATHIHRHWIQNCWGGKEGREGTLPEASRKQPLGDRGLAIQSFEKPRYFPPRLDYLLSEDDDALLLRFLMFLLVQVNDPSNPYTFGVATVKYQGSDFQKWNRLIGEDTEKFGKGAESEPGFMGDSRNP